MERTFLVLESGEVFAGSGFGYSAPTLDEVVPRQLRFSAVGEVVFNTAMVGYHEVLTDPSYTGQLVVMTYPHIGNYGTKDEWSESGPLHDTHGCIVDPRPVKAAGFIVRSLYRGPVADDRVTVDAYLRTNEIPGISDIDTRRLTLLLRDKGSKGGVLIRSRFSQAQELSRPEVDAAMKYLKAYPSMAGLNLVPMVGTKYEIPNNEISDKLHIALFDCGVKANIIQEFSKLNCRISVFPSDSSAERILQSNPDGVMISNGPGDPGTLIEQTEVVKNLIGKIPVFGICLGHQLIAQALGAKTYKMKFGHHGINHPVRDERTKRVFVTSQNHGFAVDEKSLPKEAEVWFRNANDGTNEGIYSDSLALYTAQFHPESAPGPYDSHWIFKAFLNAIPPRKEKR
ncbi:MAG: glutamine-hydrolyzing carbamoyl-phosphate synthase small subunit [Spirochaetales bacterium]|nr:glutamine-hydrolyzing carbamoyl-phosphate synthase small subunit [Spirochaetales bacterium]